MNDNRFPWLILVPRIDRVTEIYHLPQSDRTLLMDEIALASACLTEQFETDKINVGALGNIVAQLHVHVIARKKSDPAWPGPVWGHEMAISYQDTIADRLVNEIDTALNRGLEIL